MVWRLARSIFVVTLMAFATSGGSAARAKAPDPATFAAARAQCNEGWKAFQAGDVDRSRQILESALAVLGEAEGDQKRTLGACLYNHGRVAEQLGLIEVARIDYQRSLAVRDNAVVKARLATLPQPAAPNGVAAPPISPSTSSSAPSTTPHTAGHGATCAELRVAEGRPHDGDTHAVIPASHGIRGTKRSVLLVRVGNDHGASAECGEPDGADDGVTAALWLAIKDEHGVVRFVERLYGQSWGIAEDGHVDDGELRTGTYPGVGVVATILVGGGEYERSGASGVSHTRKDTVLCAVSDVPRCVRVVKERSTEWTETESETDSRFEQTLNVTEEGVEVRVVAKRGHTERGAGLAPGKYTWAELFSDKPSAP